MTGDTKYRSFRAFSLLELMIVISVIAVLAAIAMPMLESGRTTRLLASARLLTADLDYAKAQSIAHGDDPRMLVVEPDDNAWYIAAASDPATPLTHTSTERPIRVKLGQADAQHLRGVTWQHYSFDDDDCLGFGQFGELDQTNDATLTLAEGNASVTITIESLSGEISVGPIE